MHVEVCRNAQESKGKTWNLVDEAIYSIVVFKIDVCFVLSNEGLQIIALLKTVII